MQFLPSGLQSWFVEVVTAFGRVGTSTQSYSMSDPASTGMGDRLWVGKPPRYVTSHCGKSAGTLWSLGFVQST